MVTVPSATPVTTPDELTVALFVSLEDHVMTRPVSTLPLASLVVADNAFVFPILTDELEGETVTVATGIGVTVIVDVPVLPSLVAVIVAVPTATAVTTPLDETVATPGVLVDQVIARPVSVFPDASLSVALSAWV